MSRGNRDGRPIFSRKDLQEMGYAGIIESQLMMLVSVDAQQRALAELRETGNHTLLTHDQEVRIRKDIEDRIDLEEYYEIERQTVENR
jgi:methylisocitrate lyase